MLPRYRGFWASAAHLQHLGATSVFDKSFSFRWLCFGWKSNGLGPTSSRSSSGLRTYGNNCLRTLTGRYTFGTQNRQNKKTNRPKTKIGSEDICKYLPEDSHSFILLAYWVWRHTQNTLTCLDAEIRILSKTWEVLNVIMTHHPTSRSMI